MAAAVLAGCSNEELTSENFNGGAKIDATNFSLVNIKGGIDSRIVTVPGYDLDGAGTGTQWVIPAQAWEVGDQIGFSHIYRVNQEITTNYNFKIAQAADIDVDGNAVFTTDNSTIFAGDYFVYSPFNEEYADYNGVPVEIPAYQSQDVASPIKANDVLNASTQAKFEAAVNHLTKFSISNRITADAQVNQQEFSLNEFTGTMYLKLYPVNQTQDIKVHRVEITCDENFATSGRFLAEAGKKEPVFHASETKENKIILAFDQLLTIPANTLEADAYMGYISLLPATYNNLKFKIFYTETGNMKSVEVSKTRIPVQSNTAIRINLPIDAHGAVEATSYDIYTEAEFAEAVTKSNAMNAGTSSEAVFNLMKDIELTAAYTLSAKVPVTFNGGKTVTLKDGVNLTFNSAEDIVFDNVLTDDGTTTPQNAVATVMKGDVTIKGVNSETLQLYIKDGDVTILNEEDRGNLHRVKNYGNLILKNVDIASFVHNGESATDLATLELTNASIGSYLQGLSTAAGSVTLNNVQIVGYWDNQQGNMSATTVTVGGDWTNTKGNLTATGVTVAGAYTSTASAQTIAASMQNVIVNGAFTQAGGELNLSGNNDLGWKTVSGSAVSSGFDADSKVNVTAGTTTLGVATIDAEMNVAGTVEAKFATTLNAIVKVATTGKYTAQGALNNLKNATMELEGTLETAGTVELADDFSYCGTINNKTTGKWLLATGKAVSQHNHAHGSTAVFNNEGEVVVEGVTSTTATDIQNMPKNLYNKVNDGRLVWKGMPTVASIATFAKLDADHCWASDFNAVVTGTSESLSMTASTTEAWDWSAYNVIIDATSLAHSVTIATGKPLNVKNLTINLVSANLTFGYTATVGQPTGLKVAEKMIITNASTANLEYTNCATLTKDLTVSANSAMKVNQAAALLKYTDTFTQINDQNINFVHGSPKKAN